MVCNCGNCRHFDGDCHCALPAGMGAPLIPRIIAPQQVVCSKHESPADEDVPEPDPAGWEDYESATQDDDDATCEDYPGQHIGGPDFAPKRWQKKVVDLKSRING